MSAAIETIIQAAGSHDPNGVLLEEGRKRAVGGALNEARQLLARRLEIAPDDVKALRVMAFAEMGLGDMTSAHEHLLHAQDVEPDDKGTLVNLFTVCYEMGMSADAAKYSERAVKLYPDCAEAHFFFSRTAKYDSGHWHIQPLEEAFARSRPGSHDRKLLGFAIFKARHALGRYEEAFSALDEANAIKAKELPYVPALEEQKVMALMAAFSPDRARGFSKGGYRGVSPIFILGMPRSGSTLTEQILASHPDVFGGGEDSLVETMVVNNFLDRSGEIGLPDMSLATPERLKAAGQALAEEHARRAGGNRRYTDKSLLNVFWVGYIMAMFPEAKIIHMRRSPAALCLSNYEASFENNDIRFIYDLEGIAHHMVLQERIMAWWKVLYPGAILDFSYEALTQDQQGETERLLAFCGLDWNDACLSFHTTERRVATHSAAQVRQPIYSGIDRKTAHYEKQLEPAFRILRENGLL